MVAGRSPVPLYRRQTPWGRQYSPPIAGQVRRCSRTLVSHSRGHWFDPSTTHQRFSLSPLGVPTPCQQAGSAQSYSKSQATSALLPTLASFLIAAVVFLAVAPRREEMGMRRVCLAFIFLASLIVASCTPYQASGETGGYYVVFIDEGVYRVTFQGNAYTSDERAADFALLRSAQLALEHGFTYFVLAEGTNVPQYGTVATASAGSTDNARVAAHTGYAVALTAGKRFGLSGLIYMPQVNNVVVYFKRKPDVDGLVYEAPSVFAALAKKYKGEEIPK